MEDEGCAGSGGVDTGGSVTTEQWIDSRGRSDDQSEQRIRPFSEGDIGDRRDNLSDPLHSSRHRNERPEEHNGSIFQRGGDLRKLDIERVPPAHRATASDPGRSVERSGNGEHYNRPDADNKQRAVPSVRWSELAPNSSELDGFQSWVIKSSDISRYWGLIKPGLENIIDRASTKDGTKPSFIPEDVYTKISVGDCVLVCTFQDRIFAGFVVLGQEVDQFTGQKSLLAWLSYNRVDGAVEATIPFLEKLGKAGGFQYLTMYTNRKGWLRLGPKIGFKLRDYVLFKRLE